ncbi:MAG TPA: S26 family signal peptidase, partial [Candidatus Thermoplasmatota archaeon]|nr:S26 family signal peptidase [Candidatus Thermoplasmatota archaeon]
MRTPAWMKERLPRLHRFLTRTDKPFPGLRDALGLALAALVLWLLLITVTGQLFHGSPVRVVESGSMMHCDEGVNRGWHTGTSCGANRFGRLGTIDPGDIVFVFDVDGRGDVRTFASGGEHRYGGPGDTILFEPNGLAGGTPIIHRAMFWLEVNGDGTYTVPELGWDHLGASELNQRVMELDAGTYRTAGACTLSLHGLTPADSGFITKGDNNPCFDPYRPVQPSWVIGKARGEVPWIGLVKLGFYDLVGGTHNYRNAPGDVKGFMWGTLALLIGAPVVAEAILKRRASRGGADEDESGSADDAEDDGGDGGG